MYDLLKTTSMAQSRSVHLHNDSSGIDCFANSVHTLCLISMYKNALTILCGSRNVLALRGSEESRRIDDLFQLPGVGLVDLRSD